MKIRERRDFFLAKIAGRDIDVGTLVPPVASSTSEALMLEISDRLDDIEHGSGDDPVSAFSVQKVEPYLYYIEYDQLDYEHGEEYFLHKYNPDFGACSSVRNGNYYGRNYDWYYDDKASFVVHRKATQGRFASIGVAGSLITEEMANSGEYDELYKYLPFITLDGINQNGVTCNINMIPAIDRRGTTTGTNPGKPNVPMACLVRRILDEATSAQDAVSRIQNDYNIIAPTKEGLAMECHFMIADATDTFVIEFNENEVVVVDSFVDDKPIMTNFYLDGFDIVEGTKTGLTPHAEGIERYDILSDGFSGITSAETMTELMSRVKYTKTYDKELTPFWWSEFYGEWRGRDFNINSDPEDFKEEIFAFVDSVYPPEDREVRTSWHTVHSVVYDIEKRMMYVTVQENDNVKVFSLPIIGETVASVGDSITSDDVLDAMAVTGFASCLYGSSGSEDVLLQDENGNLLIM